MCDNKVHAQAACAPDEDTQSMAKAQCGRDCARPLCARAPDPGADDTHVSRCPRRYATCLWTPRCARTMICDTESSGSASSRRARLEWVCKCGRFAPAPARCRRQTRRRTHTGGLETPCCRVDHAWGTSARDRRAHSERRHKTVRISGILQNGWVVWARLCASCRAGMGVRASLGSKARRMTPCTPCHRC